MKRYILCTLTLLCCVLLGGCFEDDAVWLPDSSGIIFVRTDGAIVHYNIGGKSEKAIVKQDWITNSEGTEKPGVSPRGDRIALVRHTASDKRETAQVLIFDMAGKQVQASEEFPLPGHKKLSPKPITCLGRAHWSPDGQHVLLTLIADLYEDGKPIKLIPRKPDEKSKQSSIVTTCIYDVPGNRFIMVPGVVETELAGMANLSPITPAGDGFLAESSDDIAESQEDNLYFVDWKGSKTVLALSKAAKALEDAPAEKTPPQNTPGGISVFGRWEDGKLLIADGKGYLVIDPLKRWIDYQENAEISKLDEFAKSEKVWIRPLKSGLILVPRTKYEEGKTVNSLELMQRKGGGDELTWDKKSIPNVEDVIGVIASPNQKYWLILTKRDQQSRKLIVDAEFNVVADLLEPALPSKDDKGESAVPAPAPAPAPVPNAPAQVPSA